MQLPRWSGVAERIAYWDRGRAFLEGPIEQFDEVLMLVASGAETLEETLDVGLLVLVVGAEASDSVDCAGDQSL